MFVWATLIVKLVKEIEEEQLYVFWILIYGAILIKCLCLDKNVENYKLTVKLSIKI